ncbi:MAG: aminotransferase class V-fold PLP-dependent enzyme [Polaromonas sp.]|nr:aminotransferase class V-fold PLP-dependent enzyme [Polaromonas sp.]
MNLPQSSIQRIPGRRFVHSPGPTNVPPEVIEAMSRQPMDLADTRLDPIIANCESGLKKLLQTKTADVFMYAANGHGAWEAAIVNLLAPGQTVLVAGTGHFSESWALQTEALGGTVIRTPWVEGFPIDANVIEAALRADTTRQIVAVFTVHTDTASGMTSDLAAIRGAIDAAGHPALFVVDVVASLAAAPFDMDTLRANVVVGASQKGLMCPPGLGFVAADEEAMAVAARNPNPRFYWDWKRRQSDLGYRKFCGTAPQNLLMGLQAALDLIFLEGIEEVFARHDRIAKATHAAVSCWSEAGALQFFSKVPEARSVSITAVEVAPGIDVEALRTVAREQFQVAFAGGLGPLAGRLFRIGHLGDMNTAMILGCLGGIEAAMQVTGVPFGSGGLAKAIACLAETTKHKDKGG